MSRKDHQKLIHGVLQRFRWYGFGEQGVDCYSATSIIMIINRSLEKDSFDRNCGGHSGTSVNNGT